MCNTDSWAHALLHGAHGHVSLRATSLPGSCTLCSLRGFSPTLIFSSSQRFGPPGFPEVPDEAPPRLSGSSPAGAQLSPALCSPMHPGHLPPLLPLPAQAPNPSILLCPGTTFPLQTQPNEQNSSPRDGTGGGSPRFLFLHPFELQFQCHFNLSACVEGRKARY